MDQVGREAVVLVPEREAAQILCSAGDECRNEGNQGAVHRTGDGVQTALEDEGGYAESSSTSSSVGQKVGVGNRAGLGKVVEVGKLDELVE